MVQLGLTVLRGGGAGERRRRWIHRGVCLEAGVKGGIVALELELRSGTGSENNEEKRSVQTNLHRAQKSQESSTSSFAVDTTVSSGNDLAVSGERTGVL